MLSITGYIALVTGASSGIGLATARALAEEGAHVILAARRTDRLEAEALRLSETFGVRTLPLPLDVTDKTQVAQTLQGLPPEWADIDILVNSAGLARGLERLQDGHLQDWEEMIDTNLKGLLYVTRQVLPGMITRRRGHVVLLGSLAGHNVYQGGNVYCATKFGVNALTQGMRLDLLGTPIRVTSIDPGMVETEFSTVRFHGDQQRADTVYQGLQPLRPEDIAEIITFCVTRPPHVNIQDVLVLCTSQAGGGSQVHRAVQPPA